MASEKQENYNIGITYLITDVGHGKTQNLVLINRNGNEIGYYSCPRDQGIHREISVDHLGELKKHFDGGNSTSRILSENESILARKLLDHPEGLDQSKKDDILKNLIFAENPQA